MRGDYLADATALRQMAFVMKGGRGIAIKGVIASSLLTSMGG